jgi:Flp pilus assembly pilin Flp
MRVFLARFLDDTGGASFLDFSLVAAFIALVVVSAVAVIGSDMEKPFQAITSVLNGSVSNP